MNYKLYLSSPQWNNKKQKVFTSGYGKECWICGNTKVDVHHKTYKRIGREYIKDLVPLCRHHHYLAHKLSKRKGWNLYNATNSIKNTTRKYRGFWWGKKEIHDYWKTYRNEKIKIKKMGFL